MKAGFARADITPPVGTHKIGWLIDIVSETVLDPLQARAAAFESAGQQIGFIQLDTLSVRWTQASDIRARVEREHGFPGDRLMVGATHNHAGPAIANVGDAPRDDACAEAVTRKCVQVFGESLSRMTEAAIGLGRAFEFEVGWNRRIVMRDGTVKTHGCFGRDRDCLCVEGPVDPEMAVLAARDAGGAPLGLIVNFADHPAHHGGSTELSGGFPGVLEGLMRERGWPVTLFLNGACGNISTTNTADGVSLNKEEAGARLAAAADRALEDVAFRAEARLGGARTTLHLPYREVTDDEIAGTVRGAQRFVDPAAYDRAMPALLERIRARGAQPAEVQALHLDECSFVSIPAEYFVELGLRIKEESHPRRALVVSIANGMIGYVPTRQAFERGGYETTFGPHSRMAPETGDLLADAAVELVQEGG